MRAGTHQNVRDWHRERLNGAAPVCGCPIQSHPGRPALPLSILGSRPPDRLSYNCYVLSAAQIDPVEGPPDGELPYIPVVLIGERPHLQRTERAGQHTRHLRPPLGRGDRGRAVPSIGFQVWRGNELTTATRATWREQLH